MAHFGYRRYVDAMADNFTGKVALITGAARGIGAGVARGFVAARRQGRARGPRARAAHRAVRRARRLRRMVGGRRTRLGRRRRGGQRCSQHTSAASTSCSPTRASRRTGPCRQIDEAAFERVVDININGVFRTLKHSTPHLEATNGYALVVASLASFTALAGLGVVQRQQGRRRVARAGVQAGGRAPRHRRRHLPPVVDRHRHRAQRRGATCRRSATSARSSPTPPTARPASRTASS